MKPQAQVDRIVRRIRRVGPASSAPASQSGLGQFGADAQDRIDQNYVFPNGRSFPMRLVTSLKAQIITRAPQLVPGHEYTLREICGEDYWLSWVAHEPNEAGRCALQLTLFGQVPLLDTEERDSANAHLYCVMPAALFAQLSNV